MCENGRYTSLCRACNGVYSRAGEWDEINTSSELRVIVSLRILFLDIEDYKGIYRDRLKSYVFDTMKWLQEELCRSHTEIHG